MRNNIIKRFFSNIFYRENSVREIIIGPSRGLRYKVNSVSGRSAIFGNYEKDTQKALSGLVKKGMVVYDLGANCGLFAILLGKLVGEGGQVYAFEPVPYIAGQITANAKLNGISNITVIKKAVLDSAGLRTFDLSMSSSDGHIVDAREGCSVGTIQADCVSLDYFVFFEKRPPPQIIKIDVEGAEAMVFKGAFNTIEKYRPVVVFELHGRDQDVLIGNMLIKHRYAVYTLDNGRLIVNLDKKWLLPVSLKPHFVAYPLEKGFIIQDLQK